MNHGSVNGATLYLSLYTAVVYSDIVYANNGSVNERNTASFNYTVVVYLSPTVGSRNPDLFYYIL